jgi:hypothetical protein
VLFFELSTAQLACYLGRVPSVSSIPE